MRMSIRSLGGSIKDYEEMLSKNIDFEEHYNVVRDEMMLNAWGEGKHKHLFLDELKGVFIPSIESLFYIFKEFGEYAGYGGQITIDVKENIVYILDTYIE